MTVEVKHPYYCNPGNYANGAVMIHHSWEEYLEEWGDADLDYNLVFRWDIIPPDPEGGADGEPTGRELHVFYLLQRKGHFLPVVVKNIDDSDLPKIEKFFTPHWEYMRRVWAPYSGLPGEPKDDE